MDPHDMPDTYYVWSALGDERWMFDIDEGQKIGAALEKLTGKASQPSIIPARTYTDSPIWLNPDTLTAFFLSTPEHRALEKTWLARDEQGF